MPKPMVPHNYFDGIADPDVIAKEEAKSAQLVDEQLKHCTEILEQQLKQRSGYLHAAGAQQKKLYVLQIDQHVREQDLELSKQHNEQVLMLQQAAQQQKLVVRQQSHALQLCYKQRKTQEEHYEKQQQYYMSQQQNYENQLRYNDELQALQTQRVAAAQQVATQRAMIAQHAAAALQRAQQAVQMPHVSPASTRKAPTASALTSAYTPPPSAYYLDHQTSYTPLPQSMRSISPPTVAPVSQALLSTTKSITPSHPGAEVSSTASTGCTAEPQMQSVDLKTTSKCESTVDDKEGELVHL